LVGSFRGTAEELAKGIVDVSSVEDKLSWIFLTNERERFFFCSNSSDFRPHGLLDTKLGSSLFTEVAVFLAVISNSGVIDFLFPNTLDVWVLVVEVEGSLVTLDFADEVDEAMEVVGSVCMLLDTNTRVTCGSDGLEELLEGRVIVFERESILRISKEECLCVK